MHERVPSGCHGCAANAAATGSKEPVQGRRSTAAALGEQGVVVPKVLVDPTGRIESCTIVASSGYKDLDAATCKVIRERAKFAPAKGPDNQPIYSVYRTYISFMLDAPLPFKINPDIELTINEAPPNVKLRLDIFIKYVVEPDGAVKSCRLTRLSPPATQLLVDFACRAAGELPDRVARKANGQAVEAQDASHVRFLLGK